MAALMANPHNAAPICINRRIVIQTRRMTKNRRLAKIVRTAPERHLWVLQFHHIRAIDAACHHTVIFENDFL
jgi:hypothetical protein